MESRKYNRAEAVGELSGQPDSFGAIDIRPFREAKERGSIVKRPFSLVGGITSEETVVLLERMLEKAKAGEILGVAMVEVEKRRSFRFWMTGEASRSPTFTLGAVVKLEHELGRMINGGVT